MTTHYNNADNVQDLRTAYLAANAEAEIAKQRYTENPNHTTYGIWDEAVRRAGEILQEYQDAWRRRVGLS